jgi:hypothetical protein
MFEQGINKDTKRVLEKITSIVNEMEFYLAGGTGLSLLLGHRESVDLDFFRKESFNTEDLLKKLPGFTVLDKKKDTLTGKIENVNISFFSYDYPLLSDTLDYKGIKIASILDIALMKLSAVMQRNTRKDFIDLYFIIKDHLPLLGLIKQFGNKFNQSSEVSIPILKSLTYFVETETEPMPHMFITINWENIKTFFISESKQVMEQLTLPHNL